MLGTCIQDPHMHGVNVLLVQFIHQQIVIFKLHLITNLLHLLGLRAKKTLQIKQYLCIKLVLKWLSASANASTPIGLEGLHT